MKSTMIALLLVALLPLVIPGAAAQEQTKVDLRFDRYYNYDELSEAIRRLHEAYPDHFAWEEGHRYQDPKASPEKPIWSMVDVKLVEIFPRELPLDELRGTQALDGLELLRRGSRLSVHPVSAAHFKVFQRLAARK